MGLFVFYSQYPSDPSNDPWGLSSVFASIFFVLVVFVASIFIISFLNPISWEKKISIIFFSTLVACILPFLGIGHIKVALIELQQSSTISKVEQKYNVDMDGAIAYSEQGEFIIVETEEDKLTVYNQSGEEVHVASVIEVIKNAIELLPLSDDEKNNTYFDWYEAEAIDELDETNMESKMSLRFRYIMNEEPGEFEERIDKNEEIPKEAEKVAYHRVFNFKITTGETGEIDYSSEKMIEEDTILITYEFDGEVMYVGHTNPKPITKYMD